MAKTTTRSIFLKAWLLPVYVLVCLSYNTRYTGTPKEIQALYAKANRLLNLSDPTDATDSIALFTFQQVIKELEKNGNTSDTLLFLSYLKKGILLDVKNSSAEAIEAYLHACNLKNVNPQWSDSLLYEVSLHAGSLYYRVNNFDSANYYLLQAEALSQRFPGVSQKERLYNALGVLYHENGNYQQSISYLQHALQIISDNHPDDSVTIINIEQNIAAGYHRLGLYKLSLSLYAKLQSHGVFSSFILNNMGIGYSALGNYQQALACYRRVAPGEVPSVFSHIGYVHLQLKHFDSCEYYFNRFTALAQQKKITGNRIYSGINDLFRSKLLVEQQQYDAALITLQKAIISFSGHFITSDINSNPSNFIGTFTSYHLYRALFEKGKIFEQLYKLRKNDAYLQAALSAYNSAISLLRYIEKSYDSDEAKLFLKNNSQQTFQQAFTICLQLHTLYPKAGYLEQAFITGERNKASVMYAGVKEKAFQNIPGIDPALIQQERVIKTKLGHLNLESDRKQDSATLEKIAKEKASLEIQLSQLQNKIEQNSSYYKLKYSESYPGIQEIREHINRQQAVISFYTTPNKLYAFVITRSAFGFTAIDSFPALQQTIVNLLTALKSTGSGRKFKGEQWAAALYPQLVKPVQALAGDKEEWIIIPDGLLYYLPFESLPAGDGTKTLLETTEISYQFASRFLVATPSQKMAPASYSVLAFAPFVQKGMPFPHHEFKYMNQLSASGSEIAGLPGKYFTNTLATKQQFLKEINHFPVVHLATHAIADTANSSASFIAFYPQTQTPAEDGLYLEELYSLNMDATQLIIISACETGNGQLVNSEGVLSLTRGFAYAGCASMVNSLWKADDEATSAILRQFHVYLQKGYTKSKALRLAKLDYLHSNALHKTPDYWAHLILIGNTEPVVKKFSSYVIWIPAVSVLLTTLFIVWKARRGRRKKST